MGASIVLRHEGYHELPSGDRAALDSANLQMVLQYWNQQGSVEDKSALDAPLHLLLVS